MVVYLLATLLLGAAFDAGMSSEELRQTGLSKLTPQEKVALQNWLDTHYAKKPIAQGMSSKKTAKSPSLQDNLNNGHLIRLTDGSLWEIRPSDTPITAGWITQVEIKVSSTGDSTYPFSLTNTLTGSSVWARKAESKQAQPKR